MDNVESAEQAVEKKKTKRDKVRSAWISFAGRIVAQLVGAIATVALGVMVLHRYTSNDTRPPDSELRHDASAQPGLPNPADALGPQPASGTQRGQPLTYVIVITPAMMRQRDAEVRIRPADSSCTPTLDSPSTSAVQLTNGALLSR